MYYRLGVIIISIAISWSVSSAPTEVQNVGKAETKAGEIEAANRGDPHPPGPASIQKGDPDPPLRKERLWFIKLPNFFSLFADHPPPPVPPPPPPVIIINPHQPSCPCGSTTGLPSSESTTSTSSTPIIETTESTAETSTTSTTTSTTEASPARATGLPSIRPNPPKPSRGDGDNTTSTTESTTTTTTVNPDTSSTLPTSTTTTTTTPGPSSSFHLSLSFEPSWPAALVAMASPFFNPGESNKGEPVKVIPPGESNKGEPVQVLPPGNSTEGTEKFENHNINQEEQKHEDRDSFLVTEQQLGEEMEHERGPDSIRAGEVW